MTNVDTDGLRRAVLSAHRAAVRAQRGIEGIPEGKRDNVSIQRRVEAREAWAELKGRIHMLVLVEGDGYWLERHGI